MGCSEPQKFADSDSDGVLDIFDAFPNDATETLDTDGDGIGNNADTDDDGDTLLDITETNTGWIVRIPIELGVTSEYNFISTHVTSNPLKKDTDGDGVHDNIEKER